MTQDTAIKDIETMSFEEALKELEDIVRVLERGDAGLDQAINRYERGMALKQFCDKKLQESKLKVDKIVQTPTGEVTTEPTSFGE